MRFTSNKYLALICALAASVALGACGDDDDDGDDDAPDAAGFDANDTDAGEPDAGGPDATAFEGTIALIDVKVTNDFSSLGIPPLAGATVTITFSDPTKDTSSVPFDQTPGCEVHVYDLDADPPQALGPELDEGKITISGTASPIGECNFLGDDYHCSIGGEALAAGTTMSPGPSGTSLVVASNIDWSTKDPIGSNVQLSGFTTAANNGVFPVVGVADSVPGGENDHHVLVIGKTTAAPGDAVGAGGGGALFITGAAPTPAQRPMFSVDGEVTITKAAGPHSGAISFKVTPPGQAEGETEEFTLADDSVQPEAVPLTADEDFTVTCTGAGGSCGSAGVGPLNAFAFSGSTSDGDIATVKPFEMPTPVHKFATFTCTNISTSTIEIPKEVWAVVLGTNPTRIETRVIRGKGGLNVTKGVNVLAGQGLVGWTNVPQK